MGPCTTNLVIVQSSIDVHLNGAQNEHTAANSEVNPVLDNTIESATLLFEVKSLRVKDSFGELGFYTGVISKETGLPHGYGRVNFQNGTWCDCHWEHGRFARHYSSNNNNNNSFFKNNNQFAVIDEKHNFNKKHYWIESLTDGSVMH